MHPSKLRTSRPTNTKRLRHGAELHHGIVGLELRSEELELEKDLTAVFFFRWTENFDELKLLRTTRQGGTNLNGVLWMGKGCAKV